MAHYILHKEIDAIQWDGDNYNSIEKTFGKDWILGVEADEYDKFHNLHHPYIRLKNKDDDNLVTCVHLGHYIAREKGSDKVFEIKRDTFEKGNWVKDYDYGK